MNHVGSSSVLLLALLCTLSSASPPDSSPTSVVELSVIKEEMPDLIGVTSRSNESTHKRSALLTNYPLFRQSTTPEFFDSPDHNRPRYRHKEEQTFTHTPLVRSFQAASYVHDDGPYMIFFNEGRESGAEPLPTFLASQTATQTQQSAVRVPRYFDEHDKHLKLTDFEKRVKMYYNGNPELVPPFQNWKKLDEAKKKQKRLFKSFKTQKANFVISN